MLGDVSGTGHSGTLQEVPTAVEENVIQHHDEARTFAGHQGTLERENDGSARDSLSK